MKVRSKIIKRINRLVIWTAVFCMTCSLVGCGQKEKETEKHAVAVKNGEVESPDDFAKIGVYIDVGKDGVGISDVKYTISGEIATVSFRYNGVRVEFRGSCKYKQYELAGIENTSNGDLISTNVDGCSASLYTLNPGRILFWSDGQVYYSLYVYVTATDDVVKEILTHISFESRYDQRVDVQNQVAGDSRAFAEKMIKVFNDKDLNTLQDMVYYPQELGTGESIANKKELLSIDKSQLFSDILLKALNDEEALDGMRKTEEGNEFIIGTNYKNIHFILTDEGQFLITKINN